MGQLFISGMINGVAQPVLTKVSDDLERQKRVFRKMLRFTAFVSFPAMLGLGIVSEELITITITDKWYSSISIMQILCISGAFTPIAYLYQQLIISKGKSRIYMWNTIALGIILLSGVLCHARRLCIHQYTVATDVALLRMARNRTKAAPCTDRHTSIRCHCRYGDGNHLLFHPFHREYLSPPGKQDSARSSTLRSRHVGQPFGHL